MDPERLIEDHKSDGEVIHYGAWIRPKDVTKEPDLKKEISE